MLGSLFTDSFLLVHSLRLPLLFFALLVAILSYRYFERIKQGNEKPFIIPTEYCLILLVAMTSFSAYHSFRIQKATHAFNSNYPTAREVTMDVQIFQCTSLNKSQKQLSAIVIPLNNELRRIQAKERIFISTKFNEALVKYWKEGTQLSLVGLHIGIITLFIAQLLSCFQIHRYGVALLTLPMIYIFIQTIGCPPSACVHLL